MTFEIEIAENQSIDLECVEVTPRPDGTVTFTVEGTLSVSEHLLGTVAGSTLTPSAITFSSADSDRRQSRVEIDLQGDATLRLEAVDVGVEVLDTDLIPSDTGDLREAAVDPVGAVDSRPGVIAFTVEGVVDGVSADDIEALSSGEPKPASITFTAERSLEGDGGEPDDEVARFDFLLYRISIGRHGQITVSPRLGLGL